MKLIPSEDPRSQALPLPGRYAAGDVVMIQPHNSPEEVRLFCDLLRLDPDACFTLRPTEAGIKAFPLQSLQSRHKADGSISLPPGWQRVLSLPQPSEPGKSLRLPTSTRVSRANWLPCGPRAPELLTFKDWPGVSSVLAPSKKF